MPKSITIKKYVQGDRCSVFPGNPKQRVNSFGVITSDGLYKDGLAMGDAFAVFYDYTDKHKTTRINTENFTKNDMNSLYFYGLQRE